MIGTLQVKVQAATPNLPLQPLFAFKGSPSSLRIMDVPKSIGQWNINEVSVLVKYPDNSQDEKQAVRTGNVWVATVEGCDVTGRVVKGYEVLANGVDEDGNPVVGYVLGSGDVFVLERDSSIPEKDVEKFYVKFCETLPANPQKGDVVDDDGTVKMYDGNKWIDMGGGSAEEVGDATLTIKKNGINVGSFTANSFTNKTIDIAVPSTTNDLVNDSGFITSAAIPSTVSSFENDVGYLTSVSWGEVLDKPDVALKSEIPSNVSELENDVGYITASAIPSNVSEFNNDVGYITASAIPSTISSFENDVGYITSEAIPSNVGAFQNDVGYLTSVSWGEVQNKPDVALMSDIPSNVSELENDAGYITASAIPSQVSELENDVGYITASAIPSNISSFNNDVGYITASAIPSSYSSIRDANGNVINANRTIQRTEPGAAMWKLTQGGVTQTMTGTRTDSECEITVRGQLWKNHLEWYVDPEYGQDGWQLTQWKWNGSGWDGGLTTFDSESITATSLSFYGYEQVTINWEEEQVIVSDTLVTQSQLSTLRSMTDLSYEQSFDKNNLEGIVSFNVVETSAPLTTIVLDKYDAASQTWSGDTQDWKVMWYYEGMGENVMFQLYHNNIGVQAFQAPAQGAGTTSWTFYGGGVPIVSGTLTMNMSDSIMTTNPVKALIDSETKDKRDYNNISYYATPTTYSAYTYGIDKFTIETGWSNIWSADTSSAQVSGSTTTWALNNGLGVLTSDGQTFSLELSGSAIGTSFTMDDLKKGGVIQTTTIDTSLPYQVTANAQFFKTTFALKDALPSKVSELVNDVGYLTASTLPAIPSKTSDLLNDSGFITASAIPSQISAFENDVGYLSAVSWGQVQDKPDVALASEVPSTTSDLVNDSGFITASAIPSNVGAFTNDVGYLTTSSSAFTNKRDYDNLTNPGSVYPSETHRIRQFDLNIEGGYNPRRYTLNKFSTNVPNYGSMWANDEEYWNFAVATSNGEDFTFNKYGESGEVATFTMSDVTDGAITFTMTEDQTEYSCTLSASMYETTLALKDYVDSVVPSNTITISGIYSDLTSFAYNVYTT